MWGKLGKESGWPEGQVGPSKGLAVAGRSEAGEALWGRCEVDAQGGGRGAARAGRLDENFDKIFLVSKGVSATVS